MSKDRALLGLKRKDKETGLHYNRYRYYDPYSARYVSKDPIGLLGGLHSTKYVSDPNQWVDPMGLIGEHQKKDPFRERKGTTPLTKYVNERILKDKLDRQATEKEKRQAAKIFNEAINQQPVCEEQLIEYVTCSVGIGPKAIGFSINLYNGRVFKAEDAYSGTAVPVAVEKTMAMGAQSLKNVSKVLSKNVLTAGASCVGGHIINKENPNNVSDNTDSFLTGKSYTFSVGASIFKGGVTVSDPDKLFDSKSQKGLEFGLQTPSLGADVSSSEGKATKYQIR